MLRVYEKYNKSRDDARTSLDLFFSLEINLKGAFLKIKDNSSPEVEVLQIIRNITENSDVSIYDVYAMLEDILKGFYQCSLKKDEWPDNAISFTEELVQKIIEIRGQNRAEEKNLIKEKETIGISIAILVNTYIDNVLDILFEKNINKICDPLVRLLELFKQYIEPDLLSHLLQKIDERIIFRLDNMLIDWIDQNNSNLSILNDTRNTLLECLASVRQERLEEKPENNFIVVNNQHVRLSSGQCMFRNVFLKELTEAGVKDESLFTRFYSGTATTDEIRFLIGLSHNPDSKLFSEFDVEVTRMLGRLLTRSDDPKELIRYTFIVLQIKWRQYIQDQDWRKAIWVFNHQLNQFKQLAPLLQLTDIDQLFEGQKLQLDAVPELSTDIDDYKECQNIYMEYQNKWNAIQESKLETENDRPARGLDIAHIYYRTSEFKQDELEELHNEMLGSIDNSPRILRTILNCNQSFLLSYYFLHAAPYIAERHAKFIEKLHKINTQADASQKCDPEIFLTGNLSISIFQLLFIFGEKAYDILELTFSGTLLPLEKFLENFPILSDEFIEFLRDFFVIQKGVFPDINTFQSIILLRDVLDHISELEKEAPDELKKNELERQLKTASSWPSLLDALENVVYTCSKLEAAIRSFFEPKKQEEELEIYKKLLLKEQKFPEGSEFYCNFFRLIQFLNKVGSDNQKYILLFIKNPDLLNAIYFDELKFESKLIQESLQNYFEGLICNSIKKTVKEKIWTEEELPLLESQYPGFETLVRDIYHFYSKGKKDLTYGPLEKKQEDFMVENLVIKLLDSKESPQVKRANDEIILVFSDKDEINLSVLIRYGNFSHIDFDDEIIDLFKEKYLPDVKPLIEENGSAEDKAVQRLPVGLQAALYEYTKDSTFINQLLRDKFLDTKDDMIIISNFLIACMIAAALNRLPYLFSTEIQKNKQDQKEEQQDSPLFRKDDRIRFYYTSRAVPGVFGTQGFFSTSTSKYIASENDHLHQVARPSFLPSIKALSEHPAEEEVLLPPGHYKEVSYEVSDQEVSYRWTLLRSPAIEQNIHPWGIFASHALRYSYDHHLSQEYKDMPDAQTIDGVVINRATHGLAHTYRVMSVVPYVAQYLSHYYAKRPEVAKIFSELTNEDVEKIQILAAFSVTGRESEMSRWDNEEKFVKYKENSAIYFKTYCSTQPYRSISYREEKTAQGFLNEEEQKQGAKLIQYMCNFDKYDKMLENGELDPRFYAWGIILSIAHDLDVQRVWDSENFTWAINERDLACISPNGNEDAKADLDPLIQFMRASINEMGDTNLAFSERNTQEAPFQLFSTSVDYCESQMSLPPPIFSFAGVNQNSQSEDKGTIAPRYRH